MDDIKEYTVTVRSWDVGMSWKSAVALFGLWVKFQSAFWILNFSCKNAFTVAGI